MRRSQFLQAIAAVLGLPAASRAAAPVPQLRDLRASSGGRPFAGDGPHLTTINPRRPERRRALIRFSLTGRARVRLEAVRTDTIRVGKPLGEIVWKAERSFAAGAHEVTWRPPRDLQPRTYQLRAVVSAGGRRRTYGMHRPGSKVTGPVVRVLGVEVALAKTSYAPGEPTDLRIASDAPSLEVQVFHYAGPERFIERDLRTNGVAVTPPAHVDWRAHRDAPSGLRFLRAGEWRSGLYFVRARADDGSVGYAPFIVRPRTLGEHRVAIVLSTHTWQAYNFHDADGDGWGDSWYVSSNIRSVDVSRPFLDFGVPFRFRDWDLAFVAWLNRTGKQVDFLSDDDVEGAGTGDVLRRAYDLVVFPGHAEYVTSLGLEIVERYRELGGNLLFLSANNFFCRVRRDGPRLVREQLWRDLGRPESALVGVQYVASDYGQRQGPFVVRGADAAPWVFEGTGLANGSSFGRYGIELDARTDSSPAGTTLLAEIKDLMGAGRSAEMTYYETPAGAKVFAAGVLNFAASIDDPQVSRLVENVWTRLEPFHDGPRRRGAQDAASRRPARPGGTALHRERGS
jgi:hypothetical protein